jgi:hypothetical protein
VSISLITISRQAKNPESLKQYSILNPGQAAEAFRHARLRWHTYHASLWRIFSYNPRWGSGILSRWVDSACTTRRHGRLPRTSAQSKADCVQGCDTETVGAVIQEDAGDGGVDSGLIR